MSSRLQPAPAGRSSAPAVRESPLGRHVGLHRRCAHHVILNVTRPSEARRSAPQAGQEYGHARARQGQEDAAPARTTGRAAAGGRGLSARRLRRTSLCAKGSRGWGFVLQRGFRTRARVWGASEDAPHQKVRDGPAVAGQGGVLALPGANSRSPSRPEPSAGRAGCSRLPPHAHTPPTNASLPASSTPLPPSLDRGRLRTRTGFFPLRPRISNCRNNDRHITSTCLLTRVYHVSDE